MRDRTETKNVGRSYVDVREGTTVPVFLDTLKLRQETECRLQVPYGHLPSSMSKYHLSMSGHTTRVLVSCLFIFPPLLLPPPPPLPWR